MSQLLRRPRTALAVATVLGAVVAPAGAAQAASYTYDLGGTAKVSTLRLKGTIPLSGTVSADLGATGAVTADVKINTVTANLTELGILPIRAKVAFEAVGQSSGQLTGSSLTTTTTQNIRLVSASVFGVNIVQGSNCRTVKPSVITLTSNPFDLATGGKLSGKFSISALAGCGLLNGDLSSAIAGSNNSASATLTAR